MGFVAVSAAKYEGVHALNLVWDNQANTSYLSRSFTREGIRSGEYSTAKGIDILVLDNPRDFDRSQLEHGVMTHSFTDNTTGKHYVVLEHKRELNPDEKQAE